MEEFRLENYGFKPEQRPNYMLMQLRLMQRMTGPELSEEQWEKRYSSVFRGLIKSDPEFARLVAEGSEDSLDTIIGRLKAETKPEMSAAA